MNTQQFNATNELENLRQHKKICRQKHYQRSCLNQWRAELVELRKIGASFRELALWLRRNKRVKVSHTTIQRFLNQLPELKAIQNEEII